MIKKKTQDIYLKGQNYLEKTTTPPLTFLSVDHFWGCISRGTAESAQKIVSIESVPLGLHKSHNFQGLARSSINIDIYGSL